LQVDQGTGWTHGVLGYQQFSELQNDRGPFLTLRSNGPQVGRQGWQAIKKPGVMAGQTLIANDAERVAAGRDRA
jgi:hypothetical protein